MREVPYNRNVAVAYARRWALDRNLAYYNFDKLGGLNTDAEESNPSFVTRTVINAEHCQRNKQQTAQRQKQLPLLAQNVRVNDRQQYESAYAENHGEKLNHDELQRTVQRACGSHAGDGVVYHNRPEQGAAYAHEKQENIRPLEEGFHIGANKVNQSLYIKHLGESKIIMRSIFYHIIVLYAMAEKVYNDC